MPCPLGTIKPGTEAVKSPTAHAIWWAAGIFEGEGSFNKTAYGGNIKISQKDPWILYRLKDFFGGTVGIQQHHSKYGAQHHWVACGSRARGFIMTVFSLLSPRRKLQAKTWLGRG
jgi:hypothetical protein